MRDRLKILDCNRKNVLGLPSGAFHLWFTYYMQEDEEQESFMSYSEIEAQTGMGRTSIQKWNHYLVRHGWLIDTGKTAYDKWLALGKQPTADSKRITCWRVDDPTVHRETTDQSVEKQLTSPSESDHKVYSYGSGYGSAYCSGSESGSESASASDLCIAIRSAANGPDSNPLENPKPQTKTQGSRKSVAPDGSTWDEWNSHSQAWMAEKCIELGITKPGPSAPAPKPSPDPECFCMECGLEPVRCKTSDYCLSCWERKQERKRWKDGPSAPARKEKTKTAKASHNGFCEFFDECDRQQ